jgi:hypothetical protein
MANPWFRMYSEFSHDPKVQMMSEAMQRRYVMVMCLRCSTSLVTLQETEIAFHLRVTDEQLAETKALFVSKNFIDNEWNVLNWDKRQFASDSSAARVSKHRAKKKEISNADVTLQETKSNALEQNRTDTEQTQNKKQLSASPKYSPLDDLVDRGVDLEVAKDWLAVRKTKNLTSTVTALSKIFEKLEAAGLTISEGIKICAENSWGGFNASWPRAGSTTQTGINKHGDFSKQDYQSGVSPDGSF